MTSRSIVCPTCHVSLKLPPDAGPGRKLKCTRCGSVVQAPAGAALPTARALPAISSPETTQLLEEEDEVVGLSPAAVWTIVLAAGLIMFAATGALLAICLSGETEKAPVAASDEDPFDSPSTLARPKALAKKKAAPPRALITLTAAEEAKINAMANRGVDYLKRTQITSGPDAGTWPCSAGYLVGYAGLAGLTLLECKVPSSDPSVQAAAKYVRKKIQQPMAGYQTYQVAVGILFLARLEEKADRDLIRSLALRLAAFQLPGGGWHYECPALSSTQEAALLAALQDNTGNLTRTRGSELGKLPVASLRQKDAKQGDVLRSDGDNSNTQFAILALWTARRYDLPLDGVLNLAVKRFRASQNKDGGWYYQQTQEVSQFPTMTAAGLLAMAIGYGLDGESKANRASDDALVKKGFRRLASAIGAPAAPGQKPAPVDMYFLWSVERAAVLFHLPKIEDKDWYRWGLGILEAHQHADGRWHLGVGPAGSSDIVDTSFGLLFLQRANLAEDLTDKIQELAALLGLSARKE